MPAEIFGRISKIAVTPVKGCAQVEVGTAILTPRGIKDDHEYAIVEERPDEDGVHRWVSQRDKRFPSDDAQSLGIMALILPIVTENFLQLKVDGQEVIKIPRRRTEGGDDLKIRIWNDVVGGAIDQGKRVSDWLSYYLDTPVRLVRMAPNFQRGVSQKWQANQNSLNLQDSYPLNWFTQESLDQLNDRTQPEVISWSRFRPNVIVSDSPSASSEHLFYQGYFGEVPIMNAKPCDRCPVPLINQETGLRESGQPLLALNGFKRWLKPDGKVFVIFGEGALPLSEGQISVGDTVWITEQRAQRVVFGGAGIKPRKNS